MDANIYTKDEVEDFTVSIHAPVMDANYALIKRCFFGCFNPRARDGRESPCNSGIGWIGVSIHAPVMDANIYTKDEVEDFTVSIHAPVMDAKLDLCAVALDYQFQSTRP